MVSLAQLWLPIVVSAVVVFFASFLAWMVLPHHRKDWKKVPDEDGLMGELKKQKPAAGQYMFPFCSGAAQRKDPEFQKKWKEGPSGTLVVFAPGGANMGKSLGQYFFLCLVVAVFVAYLAGRTLAAGSEYLAVFRVAGTAAILAWCGSVAVPSIWMGKPWSVTWKDLIDGIVYGLLTAGVFGWLWP
jgi:hypothetical protein